MVILNFDLFNKREFFIFDSFLVNYNMVRVVLILNGNCFFLLVVYILEYNIICNKFILSDVIKYFDVLGLINRSDNIDICVSLRRLFVEEWLIYFDFYKLFFIGG